jgi:hypothetical protein
MGYDLVRWSGNLAIVQRPLLLHVSRRAARRLPPYRAPAPAGVASSELPSEFRGDGAGGRCHHRIRRYFDIGGHLFQWCGAESRSTRRRRSPCTRRSKSRCARWASVSIGADAAFALLSASPSADNRPSPSMAGDEAAIHASAQHERQPASSNRTLPEYLPLTRSSAYRAGACGLRVLRRLERSQTE